MGGGGGGGGGGVGGGGGGGGGGSGEAALSSLIICLPSMNAGLTWANTLTLDGDDNTGDDDGCCYDDGCDKSCSHQTVSDLPIKKVICYMYSLFKIDNSRFNG